MTDANLAMGHLEAEGFAGGTMRLDVAATEAALAGLAQQAGMGGDALAAGIQAVVNEAMAGAARVHLAEHGGEAAGLALLVTGGGGPLHGPDVARRLGLRRVICPPAAGVASALGLLLAPARVDEVATLACRLESLTGEALEARFLALEAEARRVIGETLGPDAPVRAERAADLRFLGQGHELVTPMPPGLCDIAAIRAAFEAAYRAVFAGVPPVAAVEVMNIRVAVSAATGDGRLDPMIPSGAPALPHGTRRLSMGDVPLYRRAALVEGQSIIGPAVVEDGMSTLLVPAGAVATQEANGNLVVELPA